MNFTLIVLSIIVFLLSIDTEVFNRDYYKNEEDEGLPFP